MLGSSLVTVGWGTNNTAELGAGYRSSPLANPVTGGLQGVRQIAAGYESGYAVLVDGSVRAWGGNYAGQLGDGTTTEKVNPIQIPGLSHVVQIAPGGAHVMALLANGTVLSWGGNFWGTLGNGTRDTVEGVAHPVPSLVPGLTKVVAIASGGGDDAALLADGTVVAWGENRHGQLGDGTHETKLTPTRVKGLTNVRQIALGGISSVGGHMLALRGGRVLAAGQNERGQLGVGDTSDRFVPVPLPALTNVTAVSASGSHSLALLAGGRVLSWGSDENGELGYRATERCEAVACGRVPRPVPVAGASAISAAWRFSVAVSNGGVLSWGANGFGQLGDGSTADRTAPARLSGIAGVQAVSASETFTLALAQSGPSPEFSVLARPGALLAQWASLPGAEPWTVSWRPFHRPHLQWGKPVILPATTHSYLIPRLARRLYEVRLTRVGSSFGYRVASAIPG